MDRSNEVLQYLEQLSIPYTLYRHQPMMTIEECQHIEGVDWQQAAMCKNVFLCNRQQTLYYLMLLRPHTAFRTSVVSKALGVSRLSFAPQDALPRLLNLTAGAVSPLGLYFDKAQAITLCYERTVRDTAQIAFHPCDNRATVVLGQEAFWERVLPLLRVKPVAVELECDTIP